MKKQKVRLQKIRYSYTDANMIPDLNDYLLNSGLDMKLIKFSIDMFQKVIKIDIRSDIETRKAIASKLRELDIDITDYSIKKKLFYQRLIIQRNNNILEESVESSLGV